MVTSSTIKEHTNKDWVTTEWIEWRVVKARMVARRQIEFIWNCKLSALANTRKPTTMPTLGRAYLASFLFQTFALYWVDGRPSKKAVHVLQQEELGEGWDFAWMTESLVCLNCWIHTVESHIGFCELAAPSLHTYNPHYTKAPLPSPPHSSFTRCPTQEWESME